MAEGGENKRKAEQQLQQNKLLEQLTCPICMEVMCGPIYMCTNPQVQHNMCEGCKGKMKDEKCPSCGKVGLTNRNKTLENLTDIVTTVCPHEGCNDTTLVSKLQEHKASCLFAPLKCCLMFKKCAFQTGSSDDFTAHLQEKHGSSCLVSPPNVGIGATSEQAFLVMFHDAKTKADFAKGKVERRRVVRAGEDSYLVYALRHKADFGQGAFKVFVFQLTKPGVKGKTGKDVMLRVYGPEAEDKKNLEFAVEVMNYRLPPPGVTFPFSVDKIPVRFEGEVTDKMLLRCNGHQGNSDVEVLPVGLEVWFRMVFA